MTGLSHFIVIFRQAHQVLPKCPDGQSAMAQTLQEKYMQLAYPTHNLCQLFLSKPVTSSSLPSTFLPLFSYFPDRLYHSVYMLLFPVPLPRVASAHIPQGGAHSFSWILEQTYRNEFQCLRTGQRIRRLAIT